MVFLLGYFSGRRCFLFLKPFAFELALKKDDFSRKPNPGMLLNAISYFDLDPQLCILIGDAETDIHAGLAADIGTNIYLGSNNITIADCSKQIFSFPSLEEVIRFLWSYRL